MSFRKMILEHQEEQVSIEDIVELIKKLELSSNELSEIADNIIDEYVIFEDELTDDQLNWISFDENYGGDGVIEPDDYYIGQNNVEDELTDDQLNWISFDKNYGGDGVIEPDDYYIGQNNVEEAFVKVNKGVRLANRRQSKKERRKPQVKKSLHKRSAKQTKCSSNQRVTKIGPNVFKCVPKNSKDKRKSRRLKKFKKLYKNG